MIKFTKKALSLAIASFVTMTSIFGSSNLAKAAETTTNTTETAATATSDSNIQTHLSANFAAPSDWTNVYAYAYYVEKGATKAEDKIIEPLGCWPGTKLEKGADGLYPVEFESSIGSAKIIFTDMKEKGEYTTIGEDGKPCKPYYNGKVLHQLPADDGDEETEDGYTITGNTTIKSANISFKAPTTWDNVYAYVYYTDDNNKLQEPLGYWPGTKLEKGTDGLYKINDIGIITSIGEAKCIFTNVDESVTPVSEAKLLPNDINGYYYNVEKKAQLPEDDGDESTENGYKVDGTENNFDSDIVPTAGPISTLKPTLTPTVIPTATPTVTPVITATVTPSAIPTVTPVITATVTPSAVPTVTPVVTPTVEPTITPTVEPTIIPTIVPTTVPTVTPSAVPTVTPSAVPVVTPSAIPTVTPSAVPVVTPSAIPTVVPTVIPTAVPVVTPSAIPTVTPGVVIDNDIPNEPVKVSTSAALKGSISFDKTNKTVGETIKIKVSAKNGKAGYKYTYIVKKGNKKVTLASNTKSKSVNWIPTKAGTYTVSVKITDAKKKSVTVSKKYKVKNAVITIKNFKTNKSSGQKIKTKIVISAKATTKKGKASYKFAVKLGNGKVKTIKGFSSKKKITWKPTKKGTYTLYVYVKNGKGITVSKTKIFKIKK